MKKSVKQFIWSKRVMGSIVVVGALMTTGVILGLGGYFGGGEKGVPEDTWTRGLVLAYNFDEGSGQIAYNAAATGSVNDGTLGSSAGSDVNDPAWTSGGGSQTSASSGSLTSSAAGGSALDFDGTDDYVNCGNDSSLDITDAITLEAWVKTTDKSVLQTIVGRDDGTNRNYFLEFESSGVEMVVWIGGIAKIAETSTALSDNTWYHVVGTYDGSNINIYLNGVVDDTPTATTGNIDNDDVSLSIGAREDGLDRHFNGAIDSVKIYNRALSAEEVRYHYNRGGPVAHWGFDEGAGSTAYDSTDNNNDGTLHLGAGGNTATSSAWVAGKRGSAIDLDGTDDYIDAGDIDL